jgi:gluconate kinase
MYKVLDRSGNKVPFVACSTVLKHTRDRILSNSKYIMVIFIFCQGGEAFQATPFRNEHKQVSLEGFVVNSRLAHKMFLSEPTHIHPPVLGNIVKYFTV